MGPAVEGGEEVLAHLPAVPRGWVCTRDGRIVTALIDFIDWNDGLPGVDEVRPARCPRCARASRPAGKPLGLHGHGVRERLQLGPVELDGEPRELGVWVRRYRCRHCRAVCAVVPRGVLPRRRYSARAVALALCLWALEREPAREVRRRVSPFRHVGPSAEAGWASLRRWALCPPWPTDAAQGAARSRAANVVRWLLGRSLLSASEHGPTARVFAAAAQGG